jgi:hypothetical protein
MKIETTSSIPGEISSVSDVIWSNNGKYFKGLVPTTFSILMTPSLFKTDSSLWKSDTTGYHISIDKDTTYGSQSYAKEYLICRFKYNQSLGVDVILYKNWSVLQTQRLKVQSTESLLSNLSGSIVGIMGISGFIMNLVEDNYLKYKRNRNTRLKFLRVLGQRKKIFNKNFLMSVNQLRESKPYLDEVPNIYGYFSPEDPLKYKVEGLDTP